MESTQSNPEKKLVEYYTANSQKVHVAEQHRAEKAQLSGTDLEWTLSRNRIPNMRPTGLRQSVDLAKKNTTLCSMNGEQSTRARGQLLFCRKFHHGAREYAARRSRDGRGNQDKG